MEISQALFNSKYSILPFMTKSWKNANGQIYDEYEKEIGEIRKMCEGKYFFVFFAIASKFLEAENISKDKLPGKYNRDYFEREKPAEVNLI